MDSSGYLRQIESALEGNAFDIVGVSAGFDTYRKDWGGLLDTEDYGQIGQMIKKKCDACKAKRFALLEGGYHQDLADNIDSFIQGFK